MTRPTAYRASLLVIALCALLPAAKCPPESIPCPQPGGTADPTTWCGCLDVSGRSGPVPQLLPACAASPEPSPSVTPSPSAPPNGEPSIPPTPPSAPPSASPEPPTHPPTGCGDTSEGVPNTQECPREQPAYYRSLDAAQRSVLAAHPECFDSRSEDRIRITDAACYHRELVAALERAGLCAIFDGEEIGVKAGPAYSEQYDVDSAQGWVLHGPGTYKATCRPATFTWVAPAGTPPASPSPEPQPSPSASPQAGCVPRPLPAQPVPLVASWPCGQGMVPMQAGGRKLCVVRSAPGTRSCAAEMERGLLRSGDFTLDGDGYAVDQPTQRIDGFCRRMKLDWPARLVWGPDDPRHWAFEAVGEPDWCAPINQPSSNPGPSPSPGMTPSPATSPAPSSNACPPWVRVGIADMGPAGSREPARRLDATPRFGDGRGGAGLPSNNEHPTVLPDGSRVRCEDPRGVEWQVQAPSRLLSVLHPGPEYGFGAQVTSGGRVRACPPFGAASADTGEPLTVRGDGCSSWESVK